MHVVTPIMGNGRVIASTKAGGESCSIARNETHEPRLIHSYAIFASAAGGNGPFATAAAACSSWSSVE
jgi:hypothetical protein